MQFCSSAKMSEKLCLQLSKVYSVRGKSLILCKPKNSLQNDNIIAMCKTLKSQSSCVFTDMAILFNKGCVYILVNVKKRYLRKFIRHDFFSVSVCVMDLTT